MTSGPHLISPDQQKNLKTLDFFRRYEPIIDDWKAFEAAARSPLPATIWANPLKTTPELLANKIPAEPIAWYPGGFRFKPGIKPATLLPYIGGHYQIQEEAALLPVLLMSPEPGESILDLCAAPGNKSVQIAVAMKSKGLVVANDRSRARLAILRRSVSRLGLTNVALTVYDATSYQGKQSSYDRVLADVPCSGEGTIRRHKKSTPFISAKRRSRLRHIQSLILDKAITLCRPGGLIVYSTCTFAPEENESVIQAALSKHAGQISIASSPVRGFNTSPGLLSWNNEVFDPSMQHTHRVWPHQNDTGGFFVAVLRKNANKAQDLPIDDSTQLDLQPLDEVIDTFKARFGIEKNVFEGHYLQQYGKFLFIRSFKDLPPRAPAPIQAGLPFCRPAGYSQKMKTGAAMKWGPEATRNVVELPIYQAYAYGKRKRFAVSKHQFSPNTTPGYVLLKSGDMYLGLGLLRDGEAGPSIESLLPRHWIHTLSKL